MLKTLKHSNKMLPKEYWKFTEQLFPQKGFFNGVKDPSIDAIVSFSEILGIGADFSKVLKNSDVDTSIKKLLGHFQNNLDLLIQKTWVEKDDEDRKEKLQDKIPAFIAEIEEGKYQEAVSAFGEILEELAYLFFGTQIKKEDFIEYVFRIDDQMGLFWWYGGNISLLSETKDAECLRAALLIGICYLTNF
jgi:hypothetical protein